MSKRHCVSALLSATALVVYGETLAADHPDGIALSLAFDRATSEVTLNWMGSQPDFEIFRSADPAAVTAAANSIGVTGARLWVDPLPSGDLLFYRVTSAPGTVTPGAGNRMLLTGTIVGAAGFFEGEVLLEGNAITCAAASCSGAPGAAGATVVRTNGIVLPGLIDAHNHGLYDIFDETDWTPLRIYTNHNQWTAETRYHETVDCKQYLNGENSSPVDVGCEMDKYAEVKALIAGTTSLLVAPGLSRSCYASVVRTIDTAQNDLPADKIQTSVSIPSESSAQSVCNNFASGKTDAYVVHTAEGTDAAALNEFYTLTSRASGCLLSPKTTIVHGTALGAAEYATMAAHGMKLVWSPRLNMAYYNAPTRIDLAIAAGVSVIALGPDWSLGGSVNLLDELRYADALDAAQFGDILTPERLFRMVTIDAARALALDGVLGSLEVGKRADVAVIVGDRADPYRALLAARPETVRFVLVDGRALYGDANLVTAGAPGNVCEAASICGGDKFLCLAESDPTNKLNQTYAAFRQILVNALGEYDTNVAPLGVLDFSPLAPLTTCP